MPAFQLFLWPVEEYKTIYTWLTVKDASWCRRWEGVLASCGFCNKLLQTWWFKTTEIYSVTVLEVRSLRHTRAVLQRGIEQRVHLLPLLVLLGLGLHHSSLCLHLYIIFSSVCLCLFFVSQVSLCLFLIRTFVSGFRVCLKSPQLKILNYICKTSFSQIRSYPQVPELMWMYFEVVGGCHCLSLSQRTNNGFRLGDLSLFSL